MLCFGSRINNKYIYYRKKILQESQVWTLLFDTWKKWRNKIMAGKFRETLKETSAESAESILKYIRDNDIVDLSYVRKQIEMAKKEEILKKHPYKISCGKDGYWRTYLPDETKAQRRRQIKKKTEDAIKKEVIEYWEEKLDTYTFHDYFDKWMDVKMACGISENTVYKYQCDYKRFFAGTDFEKADIRNINSEYITIFMINTIKDKKLKRKAGSALWGYISGTFKSAFINRIITENPCMYVDTQLFRRHYNKKQVAVEHRIFNRDESGKLLQQLRKDHVDKPDYIPSYAVELATMTGMRVGEIVALKWSDIDVKNHVLLISKAEVSGRISKTTSISTTKNQEPRKLPLTDDLIAFFRNLEQIEKKYGYKQEFVFANKKGRIKAKVISDCARNKCIQLNIDVKSIHAIRRTVNSNMRCNGVSDTVAASILGNTPEVNTRYYTYDVMDLEIKKEILEKASL